MLSMHKINDEKRKGDDNMTKLELPIELEEHREALEKSVRKYVKITEHEAETTPYQSKLGGYPYYPKAMAYPVDANGAPMRLLLQLNFTEMPKMDGFPTEGIVQIFIPVEHDMYGCDFGDGNDQHQVIYHKHIMADTSLLVSDFDYNLEGGPDFPIQNETSLALTFEIKEEVVPYECIERQECFEMLGWEDDKYNAYLDVAQPYGNKVGGYPGFTQYDPRENADVHNILLFQLDSNPNGDGEFWIGDAGIMNFFINSEKLSKCDFSDVLYNWDCC